MAVERYICLFSCSPISALILLVGRQEGHLACKKWEEDGGGGHCLVRMEWRPGGWLVCLPLLIFHKVQKFSSGTSSPRWYRKKGRKNGCGAENCKKLSTCVNHHHTCWNFLQLSACSLKNLWWFCRRFRWTTTTKSTALTPGVCKPCLVISTRAVAVCTSTSAFPAHISLPCLLTRVTTYFSLISLPTGGWHSPRFENLLRCDGFTAMSLMSSVFGTRCTHVHTQCLSLHAFSWFTGTK